MLRQNLVKGVCVLLAIVGAQFSRAQFAPAAGLAGSTAIFRDDERFVCWATSCTLQRGYMDIAVPDSGYVSVGNESAALGRAGENGIVSLGDGGVATVSFPYPVYNGPGFDFAIFENGFATGDSSLAFLEFAFVEVSSDGHNFYRFKATSHIQDTIQLPMTGIDCSLVNNLAGKYVYGFGTPFDLEELKNEIGLNVDSITHIRLIDVVGSINPLYSSYDDFGSKINDPYPTPYPASGFDLDAVGIIHALIPNSTSSLFASNAKVTVFPNPGSPANGFQVSTEKEFVGQTWKLFDGSGRLVIENLITDQIYRIETDDYSSGIYFLKIDSLVTKVVLK